MDSLAWTADLITYAVITAVSLALLLATLIIGELFEFLDADDGIGPRAVNSTLILAVGVAFGGFGWIFTASTDLNGLVVALIAVGGGVVVGIPLGMIQMAMERSQGSTDLNHNELKGRIGIVQLATSEGLAGRVEIPTPNGGTVTLPARGGAFKVGDRVRVVDIVASTAFIESAEESD